MIFLKKLLVCIYNLQSGGAEKVLINFLDVLDKEVFEVTLLVLKKEGVYLKYIPKGIKVIYIFKTLFERKVANTILKNFNERLLYKIFVKQKYDVEISFLEGYSTKLISGSKNLSKKIAWVHADFGNYHWTEKFFSFDQEKSYYEKFDSIVCVSKMCLKSFKKIFGLEEKLNVIYNILDKNLESYNKFNFRNVFNEYKSIKLLFVGRFEREKGVERLIDVFIDILNEVDIDIVLFLVGEGSLKEKLKKVVDNNNKNEKIKFISFKKNIYDYIASSDYVVVPSYSESFCLVLAEAICLNKMCISTDTSGGREILDNGKYGLLVENSRDGIKRGILEVLKDSSLKRKYEYKLSNWNYRFRSDYIINQINKLINL